MNKKIINEMNFTEIESFTFGNNLWFNCSALLYSREDSKQIQVKNCWKDFDIKTVIYGNQLGKCWTLSPKNKNLLIRRSEALKGWDHINLDFQPSHPIHSFISKFSPSFIELSITAHKLTN